MIEWICTSSVLIMAVILLRFFFRKKISRKMQYALWSLVLVRLLLPFTFGVSSISITNWTDVEQSKVITYIADPSDLPDLAPSEPGPDATEADYALAREEYEREMAAARAAVGKPITVADLFFAVWLIGGVIVGTVFIVINIIFYLRLRHSRKPYNTASCPLAVYVTDKISSPCLFGLFRPAVYLTPKAVSENVNTEYAIIHELCHKRHGDHVWSLLRGMCLAIWWWNPLVWLAAVLSQIDSELACDESAIKCLGEESRLAYGRTLVDMIAVRKPTTGLMCAATTMVSGKKRIKERIDMIVKNPKTYLPAVIAVIMIAVFCIGCTFTGTTDGSDNDSLPSEEIGLVSEGIDVPDQVLAAAKAQVEQDYLRCREELPDYGYINWRIEALSDNYTYDDLDGMKLLVYQMNYEFLSESPENIALAGGMYITEDNWVMPGYPDCTYLVFREDGDKIEYLVTLMENDCSPGSDLFTEDLRRRIFPLQTEAFEYAMLVNGRYLALDTYQGDFPWGYSLQELSRETWDSDGFHNINHVVFDNLEITYIQVDGENSWTVTYIATTSPDVFTYRGIACGMSEADLQRDYGDDLVYAESYADNGNSVAEYDYIYGYAPAEDNTCNHIVFLIKNGVITGIEMENLIDGRLFQ